MRPSSISLSVSPPLINCGSIPEYWMIYPSTTPNGGTQLIDRLEEDSIFTDRSVGGPEGATRQV